MKEVKNADYRVHFLKRTTTGADIKPTRACVKNQSIDEIGTNLSHRSRDARHGFQEDSNTQNSLSQWLPLPGREEIGITRNIALRGFARFGFRIAADLERSFNELVQGFDQLPIDPKDEVLKRRNRRFQIFNLNRGVISPTNRSWYWQSKDTNPDAGGERRTFASLGILEENQLIRALIQADFELLPLGREMSVEPFVVGVHLMRYAARPGIPSVSSPVGFHQDGECSTFVHLVARHDITGGDTVIAADQNGNQILANFCLREPLETSVVWDSLVFHKVTPVEVISGSKIGYRDVVFLDFTLLDRNLSKLNPKLEMSSD